MNNTSAISLLDRMDAIRAKGRASIRGRQPHAKFGVPQTADPVAAGKQEMSALLAAFVAKKDAIAKRKSDTLDSEYWFAVCFQTRAQKEAFLVAMKWLIEGDKYLDGIELARRQGISLPSADIAFKLEASAMKEILRIPKQGGE